MIMYNLTKICKYIKFLLQLKNSETTLQQISIIYFIRTTGRGIIRFIDLYSTLITWK